MIYAGKPSIFSCIHFHVRRMLFYATQCLVHGLGQLQQPSDTITSKQIKQNRTQFQPTNAFKTFTQKKKNYLWIVPSAAVSIYIFHVQHSATNYLRCCGDLDCNHRRNRNKLRHRHTHTSHSRRYSQCVCVRVTFVYIIRPCKHWPGVVMKTQHSTSETFVLRIFCLFLSQLHRHRHVPHVLKRQR